MAPGFVKGSSALSPRSFATSLSRHTLIVTGRQSLQEGIYLHEGPSWTSLDVHIHPSVPCKSSMSVAAREAIPHTAIHLAPEFSV